MAFDLILRNVQLNNSNAAVDIAVAVGNPADLVVWDARTPADVIATVAQPVMGFKCGRRLFTREIPKLMQP